MKRMWIGIGLLVLLTIAGIGVSRWFVSSHDRIEDQLMATAEAAKMDDWDTAGVFLNEARTCWEQNRTGTATIADHDPMEEIDSLFSQLQTQYDLRDREGFCASAAQTARLTRAMADSQRLTWWNFF